MTSSKTGWISDKIGMKSERISKTFVAGLCSNPTRCIQSRSDVQGGFWRAAGLTYSQGGPSVLALLVPFAMFR